MQVFKQIASRRAFMQAGLFSLAGRLFGLSIKSTPHFTFGVATDEHYADKDGAIVDTDRVRDYRSALVKLPNCVQAWNTEHMAFVIQLGDFVDSGRVLASVDRIEPVFNRATAPRYHALGNHDLSGDRASYMRAIGMTSAYYHYAHKGWRFIVLDGMNVAVKGGWAPDDPHAVEGRAILDKLIADKAPNAQNWDGAVGKEQRAWLQDVLTQATAHHEKVIVFCHLPALPASCRPITLLWDHEEVRKILEANSCVKAFINGHDHPGGYGESNGIHYLTLPALVEHTQEESSYFVDVHSDRLVVRNRAGVHRVLAIRS